MSKLFQKIKKWISGLISVLLIVGVLAPGIAQAAAPIVTIDVNAPTIDSTPPISGTVSSDVPVVVDVAVSGDTDKYTATVDGSGNWVVADNIVSSMAGGQHTITATATNADGTDVATGYITIDNDWPLAKINKPDAKYVGGLVPVIAEASDITLTRMTVEIVDKNNVHTKIYDKADGQGNISTIWDTTESDISGDPIYPDGQYTIVLIAYDYFSRTTQREAQVFVDNTAPEVLTPAEYSELSTTSLAATTPVLSDGGVYISEASEDVTVVTHWELIETEDGDDATYEVTYIATDLVGNEGRSKPIIVNLTKDQIISKKGTLPLDQVKLLGGDIKDQERNEIYLDLGVNVHDWGTDYVNVWAFGNLDTSKVGSYELGYKATQIPAIDVDEPTYETRNIDVLDTVGPGAVRNLTATAGYGYVQLSWTNPADIDKDIAGLSVRRATTKGGKWEQIAILDADAVSYDDYDVINGHTYYYTIVPFDGAGNNGKAAQKVSATPKAPKVASTVYVSYDNGDEDVVAADQDVKSDDTEAEDKGTEDTKSAVPVVGIIILILLILLGLYLLYLQNPDMFSKLAFWKRNKKGSVTIGPLKNKKVQNKITPKTKSRKNK
jgi:hypothetical protein